MEAILVTPSDRLSLGTTSLKIGSDASNELVLNDPLISPVHAEITPVADGYQLTDLGSAQGTHVNDQAIFPHTPVLLQHGDTISIGAVSLTFLAQASAEPPAESTPLAASSAENTTAPGEDETAIASSLPQAETFAPGQTPEEATLPREPAAAFPQAVAPAPLFAPGAVPLAPNGQPFPPAIPVQAFAPAGYPFQAVTPSGALPQPGYPAQPGTAPLPGQFQAVASPQATPPASTGKKGRQALLWIVLALIVLLLLAGSNTATYALTRPAAPQKTATPALPSPQSTLQSYCQSVLAGDAQKIYDLLSTQARIHTSLDDIKQKFASIDFLNSSSSPYKMSYANCSYDDLRVGGSLAVATVSLTIDITMQLKTQDGTTTSTMSETVPDLTSLVWENNKWKIDYSLMSEPQPILGGDGGLATPSANPE
jgi:pSer/pThr/pTyr-binding forkhead associated (FHA) protein